MNIIQFVNRNKECSLGSYFKQARQDAMVSQSELADYIGVDVSVVDLYENGHRSIPLNHVYAITNRLNLDPNIITKKLDFSS